MKKIKPIDTLYNGYLFRSRLEARWAVFLDTLGIEYHYEPEGYDLEGIEYLPDFWLPEFQCWLEIKGGLQGEPGLDEEWDKPGRLASCTRQPVHLFPSRFSSEPSGFSCVAFENIKEDITLLLYIFDALLDLMRSQCYPSEIKDELERFENENSSVQQALVYISAHWTEKPLNTWALRFAGMTTLFGGTSSKEDIGEVYISSQHYFVTNTTRWVECETCHTIKQMRFEHKPSIRYTPVPTYQDTSANFEP